MLSLDEVNKGGVHCREMIEGIIATGEMNTSVNIGIIIHAVAEMYAQNPLEAAEELIKISVKHGLEYAKVNGLVE